MRCDATFGLVDMRERRFAATVCWPGCGRVACSSASQARSVDRRASADIAPTMSALVASTSASCSARQPIAVITCVPLISDTPSFGASSIGLSPAAHSVASHGVTLQSAQLPVRHAHRREIAETGVHAVDGIVTLGDLRDHLGRLLYLTLRGAIEAYRDVAARDRDDVRDREIVPGEAEGRYFRFSRYQRASSV